MNLRAFNAGCNAVCFEKRNIRYGMICAWAQMIDYDKITLLLGAQSVTGHNIQIDDLVGVSALAVGQEETVKILGENHSNEVDKFANLKYTINDSAILIMNAKVQMKCQVIDILHLDYIKEDNFIVLKVLEYKTDENSKFLNAY